MSPTLFGAPLRQTTRCIVRAIALIALLGVVRDARAQNSPGEPEGTTTLTQELPFETVLTRVTARTAEQQQRAAEELNRTRERIAADKAPLLERMRAAEDRILLATAEARRIKTLEENAGAERRRLLKE